MLRTSFEHVELRHALAPSDVPRIRDFIRNNVYIDDGVREYIVRLGHATRHPEDVGRADLRELLVLGISPRSYQHLLALARTTAFLNHGRAYVLPDDVKDVFPDASRHRIMRSIRAQAENVDADAILAEILGAVPFPEG